MSDDVLGLLACVPLLYVLARVASWMHSPSLTVEERARVAVFVRKRNAKLVRQATEGKDV